MSLTGKWKVVEAELGGKKLPATRFDKITLELDQTSYQLIENQVVESGFIKLVEDAVPAALSITAVYGPNKGKTFHCIYKFVAEEMIMCYNLGGGGRPLAFETVDNSLLYLVRYARL